MERTRSLKLVVGAWFAALLLCPAAEAAFPGANGRIAISSSGGGREPDGGYEFVQSYSLTGKVRFPYSCHNSPTVRCRGAASPAYSPDGKRIVFSTIDGLAMIDADGSNLRFLPRAGSTPSWSPDGRSLVFTRGRPDGPGSEVYRARADGRGLKRLTFGGGGAPVWSTRDRIAYHRCPGPRLSTRCTVRTVRADGGGDQQVLKRATSPSWSPDGRRLAVQRYAPQRETAFEEDLTVWTLDADGDDLERLSADNARAPAWSPDGRRIAFLSVDLSTFAQVLATVDADGGAPREVTSGPDPVYGPTFTSGPDWQPLPRR